LIFIIPLTSSLLYNLKDLLIFTY